jgi:hypothetical protein
MANPSKILFGLFGRLTGQSGGVALHAPGPVPRRDFVIQLKTLTPAAHLERVSAIVRHSFTRVEAVNGMQALARQQLDVADYALQTLMDDLRVIMPGQFPTTLKLAPIPVASSYGAARARMAA